MNKALVQSFVHSRYTKMITVIFGDDSDEDEEDDENDMSS